MDNREQEYGWYVTGCSRLGIAPLDRAEFSTRWQELEDWAEKLKAAEASQSLQQMDAGERATMEQRAKNDPFVRAVLVGMAEANQ